MSAIIAELCATSNSTFCQEMLHQQRGEAGAIVWLIEVLFQIGYIAAAFVFMCCIGVALGSSVVPKKE